MQKDLNEVGIKRLDVRGYSKIYNCHKYWGKKPIELYELIINEFANASSVVCDPFVGSGVLASVCRNKGISFEGCDLNPAAIDIAKMFVDPPTKKAASEVLRLLKAECEEKINQSYTLKDGNLVTHLVWNEGELDEVLAQNGKTSKILPLTESLKKELQFKETLKLRIFKDKELCKNGRINVSEGQKVSDLFTPRALQNIDHLLVAISNLSKDQQRTARFILTSSLGQMSKMVFTIANRKKSKDSRPIRKYEVGSWVIGYWRPKISFEINVWRVFEGRSVRLINALSDKKKEFPNQKGKITLKCDDALKYLKRKEASTIDLIVTDPPHSDRIPYLELSEMWNAFLGYTSDMKREFICSNSNQREKSLEDYLQRFEDLINEVGRVLIDGGIFILIFNTTDPDVWNSIKKNIQFSKSDLRYLGRFSADYSAGSVVQDNREGALKNDWCLVISKGTPKVDFASHKLPSWTKDWI